MTPTTTPEAKPLVDLSSWDALMAFVGEYVREEIEFRLEAQADERQADPESYDPEMGKPTVENFWPLLLEVQEATEAALVEAETSAQRRSLKAALHQTITLAALDGQYLVMTEEALAEHTKTWYPRPKNSEFPKINNLRYVWVRHHKSDKGS